MCLVCCQTVQRPVLDLFPAVFKRVIAFIFSWGRKIFFLCFLLRFSFLFFILPHLCFECFHFKKKCSSGWVCDGEIFWEICLEPQSDGNKQALRQKCEVVSMSQSSSFYWCTCYLFIYSNMHTVLDLASNGLPVKISLISLHRNWF